MLRNRYRDLLGKGIEELFAVQETFPPSAAGKLTHYVVFGPFEVDYDVVEAVFVSAVDVTDGTNTVDLFNNSISANPIVDQFDPDTLTAATPAVKAVTGNRRLTAGDVIVGKLVVAAADEDEDLSVRVRLERVIHEHSATVHTYGAYPK